MQANDFRLADRGTRFLAGLIDGLIVGVAYIPLIIGQPREAGGQGSPALVIIGMLLLLGILVYQIYLLIVAGQTIGKKILNIKIVKLETGENGGFVTNVLLRGLVNGLLGIIPSYGLIDALFIFREDRRCIHDLIAGTTVVKT